MRRISVVSRSSGLRLIRSRRKFAVRSSARPTTSTNSCRRVVGFETVIGLTARTTTPAVTSAAFTRNTRQKSDRGDTRAFIGPDRTTPLDIAPATCQISVRQVPVSPRARGD
jgi:hypothetical protein